MNVEWRFKRWARDVHPNRDDFGNSFPIIGSEFFNSDWLHPEVVYALDRNGTFLSHGHYISCKMLVKAFTMGVRDW